MPGIMTDMHDLRALLERAARDLSIALAMFVASGIALWPLATSRRPGLVLLGGLLGPFLAEASIHGNVQPAIVAALLRTVDGRRGCSTTT